MIQRHKKLYNFIFLFTFLFVTLFINFFHAEKNVQPNRLCPACHLLNSTLTTNQINFFQIPPLFSLETLKSCDSFQHKQIFIILPSSRSPPQI